MKHKDYYQLLGVSRDASEDEIKQAYRRLARKYHPDVSKEPQAEERIKEVNEAYEVLHDPVKRRAYNEFGANWQTGGAQRPSGWDARQSPPPSADFGDLFENLFGQRGAYGPFGGFQPPPEPPRPGQDDNASLEISLEEAYRGVTRTLQRRDRKGESRTLKVTIPPGVAEGQKIRLTGQGSRGSRGGPPGDLYLEIHLQSHPLYRLDGTHLVVDLPLTPWEAALGTTVEVPTLTGRVNVTVPPGAQSGLRLRLRGRGMPANQATGSSQGDQFVQVQIVNPPLDNPEMRQLFEKMRDLSRFDPRTRFRGH